MQGKLIIFSAPSGSGKTTIVKQLLQRELPLEFSVSACSRSPRKGEQHGKDYYFLSPDIFQKKIQEDAFIEWEEVYEGNYYGTLKSELERIWAKGKHVLFDIDVKGGVNVKNKYGDAALSIFVKPPSIEELEKRLRSRGTETEESLHKRISKAETELGFANQFDKIVVNDNLESAVLETIEIVNNFIR